MSICYYISVLGDFFTVSKITGTFLSLYKFEEKFLDCNLTQGFSK